jgi:hypothetical protein
MTISIPAQLKAWMDVQDPPVNWSAVAARAFEAVVDADQPRNPDLDMTIIKAEADEPGIRLLDREDTAELRRDLDAGRIVAVFDGATCEIMAYAVCTNAKEVRAAFMTDYIHGRGLVGRD